MTHSSAFAGFAECFLMSFSLFDLNQPYWAKPGYGGSKHTYTHFPLAGQSLCSQVNALAAVSLSALSDWVSSCSMVGTPLQGAASGSSSPLPLIAVPFAQAAGYHCTHFCCLLVGYCCPCKSLDSQHVYEIRGWQWQASSVRDGDVDNSLDKDLI